MGKTLQLTWMNVGNWIQTQDSLSLVSLCPDARYTVFMLDLHAGYIILYGWSRMLKL